MARHPRHGRNERLECECGAAVVKIEDDYICVGCGKEATDGTPDPQRTKSTA